MSQKIEYPMFTPHKRAKLYKRLTNDMAIKLQNEEVITIQNNRYVYAGKFKWIENTSKQDMDEQTLNGLIVPNSYISIKTNSLKVFDDGDVVELPDGSPLSGLWIITDGKETEYIYTPKQIQTYQILPLSSVGIG